MFIRILMLFIFIIGAVQPLRAEDSPAVAKGLSIAIVDVRLLLTESTAAKSIQEQIKKLRDDFVQNLNKQENELRDMQKKLVESKEKMPAEEFAKKGKEFEEKFLKTRSEAEEKRRKLESVAAKASDKLRDKITEVVEGISDAKGYDLVLSSQNVVVGSNSLNITSQVMDALNKEVSSISVKVE